MKSYLNIFLLCLLSLTAHTQNISKAILVDGMQRNYIIHFPPSYNTNQKLPLIIALHGGGGTAKATVGFYNLEPLADKNNFIVIYPDAVNKAWNIPGMASRVKRLNSKVDDLKFISVLLDTMVAHYKADDKKVFCTGISRGAMFSYYLADALNARITAIAPVCGGISATMATTYSFKKSMPVLMINGTGDPLVNYNGGFGRMNNRNEGNDDADLLPTETLLKKIISLNACSCKPVITELPDINASDECTETEYVYNCNNIKVDFIKIKNGGHTWAGGVQYLPKFLIGRVCKDFSASQKIFDFFMQY